MMIVGVCGASGSGKTTLAKEIKEIAETMGVSCLMLSQDCYYKDQPDRTFEERERTNYDAPDVFEHDVLYADLAALRDGKPITKKRYDYSQHRRCDSDQLLQPADVVILDGIHVFYDEKLTEILDLKIYVQADPDICLLRRIERDLKERGRSIDSISRQYQTTVRPMFKKYISAYAEKADVIIPNGACDPNGGHRFTEILTHYIHAALKPANA